MHEFLKSPSYLDDDEDLIVEGSKNQSSNNNRKIEGYVEHIIPSFNDEHFKSHFRCYYCYYI